MSRRHQKPRVLPALNRTAVLPERQPTAGTKDWFRIENKKDDETDVYIYDEIGFWGTTAQDFATALQAVDAKTINLHLNSPGGEVFDGVAIYNTLLDHKAKVIVYVDGLAASAASFIAQAGDEVIMGKGSTMMIHDASGLAWGNADELRDTAKILDQLSDTIAGLYADRAGGTSEEWRAIMKAEAWYNATEAVEAGLADKVSHTEEIDEEPANRWDLTIFNYTGREEAPPPGVIRQVVLNKLKERTVPEEIKDETPQPSTPVLPPVVTEAKNSNPVQFVTMKINGVEESDPAKVQAHIESLEMFQKESRMSARDAFVDSLAKENKILASQAAGLKKLVQTYTDEQWDLFQESYESAPKLPVLGHHGVQDSSGHEKNTARAERISVLQGVVNHHRQMGMKDAELQTKDSYIELQKLLAES